MIEQLTFRASGLGAPPSRLSFPEDFFAADVGTRAIISKNMNPRLDFREKSRGLKMI